MDWLKVLAIGVVCFRLSPEQVWALTPAQYAALSDVLDEERRTIDLQLGWVRALLVEPHRDKSKHPNPFRPEDFSIYPALDKPAHAPRGEMSPDQQLAFVRGFLHPYFKARHAAETAEKGEH